MQYLSRAMFPIILSLITISSTDAQRDAHVLFGGGLENEPLGFGLSRWTISNRGSALTFEGPGPSVDLLYPNHQGSAIKMGPGSAISTPNGRLLLYSNGCSVHDGATNLPVQNFHYLNDDFWTDGCDVFRDEAQPRYNGPTQIFLPAPAKHVDSIVFAAASYLPPYGIYATRGVTVYKFARRRGRFTFVDSLTYLNVSKLSRTALNAHPIPGSNPGYWLPTLEENTNHWRFIKVADADTISRSPIIVESQTGPAIGIADHGTSQMAFSPDGNWMAFNVGNVGVELYQFDETTGSLNHYASVPHQYGVDTSWLPRYGIAFSPNSRYVYFSGPSDRDQVMRVIDLQTLDPQNPLDGAVTELGRIPHGTTQFGWPVGFGRIWSAPDCRLYIGAKAFNRIAHVILDPDLGPDDANLEIQSIELTSWMSTSNFLNFPNYRASGCNPDIPIVSQFTPTSTSTVTAAEAAGATVYPNPARNIVSIAGSSGAEFVTVYSTHGQMIAKVQCDNSGAAQLDVSTWPAGVYTAIIKRPAMANQAHYSAQTLRFVVMH